MRVFPSSSAGGVGEIQPDSHFRKARGQTEPNYKLIESFKNC